MSAVETAIDAFVDGMPMAGRNLYFHGTGLVEVNEFCGKLLLSGVIVNQDLRRAGHGTEVMKRLCLIADVHGVTIVGSIQPFGRGAVMTAGRLSHWYKTFGFVVGKDYSMRRDPVTDDGHMGSWQVSAH